MNIKLKELCGGCPEDYDVFLDGEHVGYLRLRHGTFRAWTPQLEEMIWQTNSPSGDGVFQDDERDGFLRKGIMAIILHRKGLDIQDIQDIIDIPGYEIEGTTP